MPDSTRRFPDISAILERKEKWREQRAALTFSEKLDALDALRERYAGVPKIGGSGTDDSNADKPTPSPP